MDNLRFMWARSRFFEWNRLELVFKQLQPILQMS